MTGKSGDDLILPVAPGTIAYNEDRGDVLGDLIEPGDRLIVAHGGRGGRGNARGGTRAAPRTSFNR
jgi:GTP-binding protein